MPTQGGIAYCPLCGVATMHTLWKNLIKCELCGATQPKLWLGVMLTSKRRRGGKGRTRV